MRTIVLQQGRSPRGEKYALVERVLRAVAKAYLELEQAQQDLFQDVGYTRSERRDLSSTLAETFLMNGLPHLDVSVEELEEVLPDVDLAGFLFHLLSGSDPTFLVQEYQQHYAKRTTPTRAAAPLSEVSPDNGTTRPGNIPIRTRRSGGRVGEHYRRTMPEPFLLT